MTPQAQGFSDGLKAGEDRTYKALAKELGMTAFDKEAVKKALGEQKAREDAAKSLEQKLAELQPVVTERDKLKNLIGQTAEAQMAKLPAELKQLVEQTAGDDGAARLNFMQSAAFAAIAAKLGAPAVLGGSLMPPNNAPGAPAQSATLDRGKELRQKAKDNPMSQQAQQMYSDWLLANPALATAVKG